MTEKKHSKHAALLIAVLVILGVSAVVWLLPPGKNKPVQPGIRHNILLVVSDALRPDVLGCYGGGAHTPHIDSMADNGVLFENAYSTAPCTLPSSVSMLTGNYSTAYSAILSTVGKNKRGVFYVNQKEKLPVEYFSESGWDMVMDIENQLAAGSNNFQGFRKLNTKQELTAEAVALTEQVTGIRDIEPGLTGSISHRYHRLYSLLHYVLTLPPDQHFFIVKWITDPHAPYNPPAKFMDNMAIDASGLPRADTYYSQNKTLVFREAFKKGAFSQDEMNYIKALYRAEVESVDERVGFILKALKHRELLKSTVIVFTSDHGESFGEHGFIGHGRRYSESQVRVPLIFSGPGIHSPARIRTPVSHLDLMPTLKDLCGLSDPDTMTGVSYRRLLSGEAMESRPLYFDRISNYLRAHNPVDALRMNGFKLITGKKKKRASFTLYNLLKDPRERENTYKENLESARRMYAKIKALRKENKKRLKKNLAGIDPEINLLKRYSDTLKKLKTMGYVNE